MSDEAEVASRRAAGELEAAVLAVLQEAGSALSPGEVRERIGGALAYITAVTILARLHAKGVLERTRRGGRTCTPRSPTSRVPRRAGWHGRSMARPTGSVLARRVSSLSDSDEELVRRMLGEHGMGGDPGPRGSGG